MVLQFEENVNDNRQLDYRRRRRLSRHPGAYALCPDQPNLWGRVVRCDIHKLLTEKPATTEINPRTGIPELFLARTPSVQRHPDNHRPEQERRQEPPRNQPPR